MIRLPKEPPPVPLVEKRDYNKLLKKDMNGWIDVKEQKPLHKETVIIWSPTDGCVIARFYEDDEEGFSYDIDSENHIIDKKLTNFFVEWFSSIIFEIDVGNATHWMKLPPPPKKIKSSKNEE